MALDGHSAHKGLALKLVLTPVAMPHEGGTDASQDGTDNKASHSHCNKHPNVCSALQAASNWECRQTQRASEREREATSKN